MALYIGGEVLYTTRIANWLEKNLANVMLFGVLFFTSCCFIDTSYRMFIFACFACRYMKIVLAFVLPFCATIIYYTKRKNLVVIGDYAGFIMTIFSFLFLLDCATFRITWQIHRSISLFHLLYGGVTFFAVYFAVVIITLRDSKSLNKQFIQFNKSFFVGMIGFCLTSIILIYIIDRDYFQPEIITNFIPTNGAIKRMIISKEALEIVRNVGNVGFFVAISATFCEFAPKNKRALLGIGAPILLSVFMESYQYVLRCGDTDIDDVLINAVGTLIGYVLYKNIVLKIKEKKI